jgi:hypothetical protein
MAAYWDLYDDLFELISTLHMEFMRKKVTFEINFCTNLEINFCTNLEIKYRK